MTTTQKLRITAITIVCLAVFAISYEHIATVAGQYGNGWSRYLYPICIDGVILISALTLVARAGVTKTTRYYAKLGRWFGFIATIYANVAHSGYGSTDAILVNLIPALALILTVELLIHAATGTAKYSAGRRSKAQPTTARNGLRAVA